MQDNYFGDFIYMVGYFLWIKMHLLVFYLLFNNTSEKRYPDQFCLFKKHTE